MFVNYKKKTITDHVQYAYISTEHINNRDVHIYIHYSLPITQLHYIIYIYICTCEAELGGLRMRGEAHGSTFAWTCLYSQATTFNFIQWRSCKYYYSYPTTSFLLLYVFLLLFHRKIITLYMQTFSNQKRVFIRCFQVGSEFGCIHCKNNKFLNGQVTQLTHTWLLLLSFFIFKVNFHLINTLNYLSLTNHMIRQCRICCTFPLID